MKTISVLDVFEKVQWIDKNWDGDFPEDGRLQIAHTIVVYNPKGENLYYKTDGVFRILMCIPLGFTLAWILKIPVLSIFFDYVYDWVARTRSCSV